MSDRKKQKSKNKILIITLIVIIIILLLLIFFLLKKGFEDRNSTLIPTGNVDIFELNCEQNDNCGSFDAYDNVSVWQSTNKLNIFENPVYEMNSIIAPLSTNSYQFVISNNTTFDIEYTLKFTEENVHKINMKYRLKKNSDYIVGSVDEWVNYEKLNFGVNDIVAGYDDTYLLEWKWFESDNDTAIGSVESEYSLNVFLSASQKLLNEE